MEKISFQIESQPKLVDLLSKAVKAACSLKNLSEVELYNIELSIAESAMNIIKHSYHMDPNQIIELTAIMDEDEVTFELQDTGEFKPLPVKDSHKAEEKKALSNFPESGMGLMIIYQIMDQVVFERKKGKNHLVMKMKKSAA